MSYANRVSFRKTWESADRFNDRGEPDTTVWKHRLMCGGSISVVHRLTGWGYGAWDEETGYRSPCGKFWLASGHWDIRDHLDEFDSEEGMIQWVIDRANNCVGLPARSYGISADRLHVLNNWRPRP